LTDISNAQVVDSFFWEGAKKSQLLIQRCTDCKTLVHPPTPMCPNCQSLARESAEMSGRGIVYSWIRSRHPTEPDAHPRLVAIVELEEGPRIVSNLQGIALEDVKNGMPVEVFFDEIDGVVAPQFQPSERVSK
jgi:uncharacterized OB-fold protein